MTIKYSANELYYLCFSLICTWIQMLSMSENTIQQYSWTKIFNKERTNSNYLHQVTEDIKVAVSFQNKHSWSTHTVLIRICSFPSTMGTDNQYVSSFPYFYVTHWHQAAAYLWYSAMFIHSIWGSWYAEPHQWYIQL